MTLWRKLLNKICDLTFTIPIGSDLWDSPQFEPLLVGLYLPLSRHKPWKLRGTPLLDRESTSLDKNLLVCQQGMMVASALGFKSKLFRPMEPYPLEDNVGMGATIVMLQLSLNPGRNSDHLQFAAVQKFRSTFPQHLSNGQQVTVMVKDTCKLIVTKCPTYGEFCERFARGLHKRMGNIVKQDKHCHMPF
jgi:hypothetical protein